MLRGITSVASAYELKYLLALTQSATEGQVAAGQRESALRRHSNVLQALGTVLIVATSIIWALYSVPH